MSSITDKQGPKCSKCGLIAIKLLDVPINGKVIKVCRHCKRKYLLKHQLSIEQFNQMLSSIKKSTSDINCNVD